MNRVRWAWGGALAGALVLVTVGTLAAPAGGAGGAGAGGMKDDDNYPATCQDPSQVDKITCPASLAYQETVSTVYWDSPPPQQKAATFVAAAVAVGNAKAMTCTYTADGNDRLLVTKTAAKACAASKKFRGFNCCH